MHRQTERYTDRQANRQIDRQARQAARKTDRQLDAPTTFQSITGFALPCLIHNNQPLNLCCTFPIFETSATALKTCKNTQRKTHTPSQKQHMPKTKCSSFLDQKDANPKTPIRSSRAQEKKRQPVSNPRNPSGVSVVGLSLRKDSSGRIGPRPGAAAATTISKESPRGSHTTSARGERRFWSQTTTMVVSKESSAPAE